MAKTRLFRVVNGRINFKCPSCQYKKSVPVSPRVRRRSVKCHKCNETTNCGLNRRALRREAQSGKVSMYNNLGQELTANIYNISDAGLGLELSIKDALKISVGQRFRFKCGWNPRLIGNSSYEVRSIKDQHVGLKKLN